MPNLFHLWGLLLGTVIGLLPVIDPLSAAPMFLAITEGHSDERRREQARNGCVYMVGILVSFLIAGSFIMSFFGISIPGLRIAGGILLTNIGMQMLGDHGSDPGENPEARAARAIFRSHRWPCRC